MTRKGIIYALLFCATSLVGLALWGITLLMAESRSQLEVTTWALAGLLMVVLTFLLIHSVAGERLEDS